jgi:hypothetical protein
LISLPSNRKRRKHTIRNNHSAEALSSLDPTALVFNAHTGGIFQHRLAAAAGSIKFRLWAKLEHPDIAIVVKHMSK